MSLADARSLHADLSPRLAAAAEEAHRPLNAEEMREIVRAVISSVEGDVTAGEIRLYDELEALAAFIASARHEITQIRPDEIRAKHIPSATDELDAVVEATADATNQIMDSCDVISELPGRVDDKTGRQLVDCVTRIFEACNFQDITGQRITKVVKTLKHIEAKIDDLLSAFGEEMELARHHADDAQSDSEDIGRTLAQGPQLAGQGIDQDAIDRLLASFD